MQASPIVDKEPIKFVQLKISFMQYIAFLIQS